MDLQGLSLFPHLFQSQHVCRAPIQKAHDRRPSRTGSFSASLLSFFLKVTHSGGPSLFFFSFFSLFPKLVEVIFLLRHTVTCSGSPRKKKRHDKRLRRATAIGSNQNSSFFLRFMKTRSASCFLWQIPGFFLPLKPMWPFHVFHSGLCDSVVLLLQLNSW